MPATLKRTRFGIELAHDPADIGNDARRLAVDAERVSAHRPETAAGRSPATAACRREELRLGRTIETELPDVLDHADDLPRIETAADR